MRAMLAIFAVLLGASGALAEEGEAMPYTLQPGDVISISVLEDPSLDRQVLVQPDGRISVPPAGVLMAGGRTPGELQTRLSRALAEDFVEAPAVTVALVSSPAFEASVEEAEEEEAVPRVYVLGQVQRPGGYELEDGMDMLQVLAIAGGPGVFAATGRIQLRSLTEDGVETVQILDYERLENGAPLPERFALEDGDVIFVPERGIFE